MAQSHAAAGVIGEVPRCTSFHLLTVFVIVPGLLIHRMSPPVRTATPAPERGRRHFSGWHRG